MSGSPSITTGDGVELAVHVDGPSDGPTLILSHSLGMSASMWEPQLRVLARRFRLVRYDARGHGRSDAPAGAYGIDRLAADVVEVMDAVGCARAAFCGLSLGGMIGQRLAVVAPGRIERLVLANTSAFVGPPANWQARIGTVLSRGMAIVVEPVLDRWFTAEFRGRSPAAVDRARDSLLATSPVGYAGSCAAIRDMDQRATARLITAKTLVIGGAHDVATPPGHGRYLADEIAGARYVELDAAHLSNIEAADAFTRALDGWLSAES